MQFIAQLRELSGGKPVGFKFCLGHPWEFMGIAKAMLETGILPDFIVVDGKEGGTGAAPLEFTDHIGVPLREGLLFVHNTLVGLKMCIRDRGKGILYAAFAQQGSPTGNLLATLAFFALSALPASDFILWGWRAPVSYTHLDVYKRQPQGTPRRISRSASSRPSWAAR